MYEVLYGVPPSMVTAIDCEEEELGVLPEKAIAIPTNPSLTLLKLFKRDRGTRRTFKGYLECTEC